MADDALTRAIEAVAGGRDLSVDEAAEVLDDEGPVSQPTGSRASDPMGRGRTTPAPRRPVGESRSSGRQQPTRQTKSQRKKT